MNDLTQIQRRTFLSRSSVGLGAAALGSLLERDSAGAEAKLPGIPGQAGLPHFEPKAKRVIFLCMAGGPSHLETFDYKPKLDEMNGREADGLRSRQLTL